MKFRDLKIGLKLGLFMGIGLTIVAVIAGHGYIQINRLERDFKEVTENTREINIIRAGNEVANNKIVRNEHDFYAVHAAVIRINAFLVIFLFIYGAVFGFLIWSSWLNPLNKLMAVIKKISSGDLSTRAKVETKDELGELTAAFNQMTANLQSAQEKVQAQNEELNTSSEELKSANEEIENHQEIFIGREKRIIEMKKEVNALLKELGRKEKYGGS